MKNILITGAAGYIGSHITELLIKKKYKVFAIDNLSTGHKKLLNIKAKFFKLDINNYFLLNKIIKKYNIDSIMHLAAKTNVNEAERQKHIYFKNNVTGTFNLVKACKNTKVKNFIFSSTCAVYGDKDNYVNEKSKINPKGVYALTKFRSENIIKKYFKKEKINFALLRYFNVVGASSSKKIGQINKADQLFKNLSIAVLKKNPIFKVYGNNYKTFDGTCVRDFIHVSDITEIHFKTLLKINSLNKSVVLNCGYGKGLSVLQVIKEFKKFSKHKIKVNYMKGRKGDIVKMVSNTTKLKNFLKWKPKYNNLTTMVKSSIDWEKKKIN